ncbi:hypothetical protein TWF718_006564 [Orbilia javanica]|uniref:Uncharacterized protein n=1 Tax=Orbilia javanica TaxID=47235 RepID=A0AAN8RCJ6_9PEZI
MARYQYISMFVFALLSLHLHFTAAAVLVERQLPTATYTTDTITKPTANARYQVGFPIPVSWYIPETKFNGNTAESFNVTIALDGVVAMELSQSVSYPGWGEHDTTFTARDTWPESSQYQIFIIMSYGVKTLKSPKFGIWGGGKTATPITTSRASSTSPPSTTTGEPEASTTSSSDSESTTSASASETSDVAAAPTESTDSAPSNGISGTVLGGAIGGSIAGTLAIVGLVWFMRRSMAQSRASHGSNGASGSNPNQNTAPPGYQNNGNGGQQWPYQQMNAPSTTSVNHLNNEYKGFAHPPPPPPPHSTTPSNTTMNEMPTQMHHEPVELHSITQPHHNAAIEMPGDMSWNMPPPAPVAQQQQPHRYVYGPQSYNQ